MDSSSWLSAFSSSLAERECHRNDVAAVVLLLSQVNLTLEVLALELAKAQYSCVMGLLDTMSHYQLYARYRSFKPPHLNKLRPKGAKRCIAWWVYACDCVRSDMRLKAKYVRLSSYTLSSSGSQCYCAGVC